MSILRTATFIDQRARRAREQEAQELAAAADRSGARICECGCELDDHKPPTKDDGPQPCMKCKRCWDFKDRVVPASQPEMPTQDIEKKIADSRLAKAVRFVNAITLSGPYSKFARPINWKPITAEEAGRMTKDQWQIVADQICDRLPSPETVCIIITLLKAKGL